MKAAYAWLMANAQTPWQDDSEIDLWHYRQRTIVLLKRYARASVEVGRLRDRETRSIAEDTGGMNVIEDYSPPEVARLLGCSPPTVERRSPEAVDELSRTLLRVGLLDKTHWDVARKKILSRGEKSRNRDESV